MITGSRVLDTVRLTTPDFGAVVRSCAGMVAMAALALAWDSATAAVWAAGAGAIAGAIGLQDSPGGRVPLVIAVSGQMAAAVLLGALTSPHDLVFIGVVAAWCFAAGLQWALGSHAGLVAAGAGALLVVSPPVATSVSSIVVAAALTFAAGCVQATLIAVWPPHRWRLQRDVLTRAYRSLAADARRVASDRDASIDSAPMSFLRDVFVDSQATRRPKAYHGGHRLPERIAAVLHTLGEARDAANDGVAQVLTAAGTLLDAIAAHHPTARRDAQQAVEALDSAVASTSGPNAETAQRFSRLLHEAAESRFPDLRRPDVISGLGAAAAEVRGHLTSTSPILRHAIRLSTATALGVAADRLAPVQHGYWIALVVLLVLRPETSHTYTRCVGRLGGIAAGVVLASLIATVLNPTGVAAAVLAGLFLTATYTVTRYGYVAVSGALAAAVDFLLGIDAAASGATMEDRLFAVVVGGGLAVVVHVVLPDDALTRLQQRAGELLKTEVDYAATVIKAFIRELDQPADALSAAWQRAFRARAAFEAVSGATRMESRELRRWVRSYRAALNAVTSACTALESNLPSQPRVALTPEFVAAVEDYVDALRGAPPNPAAPWTVDLAALTTANQQVREQSARLAEDNSATRVLVAEVAAITRSLSSIATTREPSAAE
ncbi:FUSC family protein [Mycobacterium deserti]|uniref:FUSC family protein n=1 Tax=Mycobacterium deserti TaxID=2978347 RepID=A0ABT2MI13_9MYCO|nr:FUSC family protein [Mycobacterium deserti]MCT7661928.1 FUSC family protein [Mycobacterium deserti]